jgi:hypothetical protein
MRISFSKSPSESGLTMIELMIALGLSALLLAVLMMLASYSARSFLAISNYVALDQSSRKALDDLTLKVREADGVLRCSQHRLDLSYHSDTLTYEYLPEKKALVRTWNGNPKAILEGCESFWFAPYQRNPIGGSYGQYDATMDVDVAKIIQVSWVCSRKAMGGLVNSESVQSAKIVIRKQ